MTNRELIRLIENHRGKVECGVLIREAVIYVFVLKGDLLSQLSRYDPDEKAVLVEVGEIEDGILTLTNP